MEIKAGDIITLDFWRYLGKAIKLFFPAIIFLLFSYFAFWNLGPAKDLMVMSLENDYVFGYCLVALIFWTYVTWYSSRLVAKAKQYKHPDDHKIWKILLLQFPRLLGFTCFTIIILAYLQLPYTDNISSRAANIIFVASFPLYFIIHALGEKVTAGFSTSKSGIPGLKRMRISIYILLLLITIPVIFLENFYGLIIMLFCWQVAIVFILIIRRKLIENRYAGSQKGVGQNSPGKISFLKQLRFLVFDREDIVYFKTFMIVASAAALIYFTTILSIYFSVKFGAFPFVLLAFGVLLGYINAVAFISILARFNFHVVFITLAILIGNFVEPHYAKLIQKNNSEAVFKRRQHITEYFRNWVNDSARKNLLNADSIPGYPVYFVLANGGGARSAYWVASVLSKFEDETNSNFSKHLFCLSGASGGSWGNSVFFNLLLNKSNLLQGDSSKTPFQVTAKSYLKKDFLTYTLARMLGPDVFRHIFPLTKAYDRDAALANAMEEVPGEKHFMYNKFAAGFSTFIARQQQNNYSLPVLCINTTRMQDGAPGIISNIDLSDSFFNRRLDVLNMIDEDKDLTLSTAIVMGGSSPYINSAQRIDQKVFNAATGKEEVHPHYFVDGGYFDNSGAGIVSEMIIELMREMNTDSIMMKYKNKLKFYVLHITNDPVDESRTHAVSPLVNDLLSPINTLIGSYGSQTSVNDLRLKNYMRSVYGDNDHYLAIDLYKKNDPMSYPVSWSISRHVVDSIDKRVATHENIPSLILKMKAVSR